MYERLVWAQHRKIASFSSTKTLQSLKDLAVVAKSGVLDEVLEYTQESHLIDA
jgi:hypothetical protein